MGRNIESCTFSNCTDSSKFCGIFMVSRSLSQNNLNYCTKLLESIVGNEKNVGIGIEVHDMNYYKRLKANFQLSQNFLMIFYIIIHDASVTITKNISLNCREMIRNKYHQNYYNQYWNLIHYRNCTSTEIIGFVSESYYYLVGSSYAKVRASFSVNLREDERRSLI